MGMEHPPADVRPAYNERRGPHGQRGQRPPPEPTQARRRILAGGWGDPGDGPLFHAAIPRQRAKMNRIESAKNGTGRSAKRKASSSQGETAIPKSLATAVRPG